MKSPKPTRWLWWMAVVITIAAAVMVYFINRDTGNIDSREQIQRVIMFAVVAVGICVISATSQWWIKR
jgi:hypothetical protein